MGIRAERAAQAMDEAAQESGRAKVRPHRFTADWLSATHPETGLEVVFKPGERLPDWVALPGEKPVDL
ncbi:hypothetical protein AB4Z14_13690 [Terrabacter sp. 2TAF16]|uniref:hypothetical protein n=1 Tax=Terrabacter sp. 2TAF16 TaxID=3233008 RepID=UPI003F953665